jgi:DNA processing protein
MQLIDITILTNIKGLGSAYIIKILNFCNANNVKSLYEIDKVDLSKVISDKLVAKTIDYLEQDLDNLYSNTKNILDEYLKNGIHCISIVDLLYPNILKESTNPPAILYCKGNVDLLSTKCIATIGTRENTPLGEKITKKTVEFLVKYNFTIVSGLAKGIDTISHKSALDNNGKTIAVLPLIDKIYPAENKSLAKEILDNNGLLISEIKPNTNFHPGQLVKRDRIQSGLSKAVFVIETSINGGSMHATNDAIKLERFVFTPNIYKLESSYQNLKQVEGIKNLIDTNKSISYTYDTYKDIVKKLNLPLKMDGLC